MRPLHHRERGSASTAIVSVVGALAIIGLVVAGLYFYETPPPTSQGRVLSLSVYPIHNQTGNSGVVHGVSGQPETFNEVIVLANVEFKNTTNVPMHLLDLDSYLYTSGSTTLEDTAASQKDFHRVFIAYPELKSRAGKPIPRGTVLALGQRIRGQLIFHYPLTLQQWKARRKLHIVIEWKHQNNLILKLHGEQSGTAWQP